MCSWRVPADGHPYAPAPTASHRCVPSPIRLLVSDIDGTLITSDKTLTDRTVDAVHRFGTAGIQFAMTSSRPPPGLAMYATPLGVTTPLGAYNGGQFCEPVTLRASIRGARTRSAHWRE